MAIDKEKIQEHVRGILIALGEDPDREGLRETPERVARMYEEVFAGISYTNDDIARMFNKTFEAPTGRNKGDIVLIKHIEAFSYCEHHMALMYDMNVSVAYIPKDRVIGLSKIVRIVDMVTRRLQLQERIGSDIAEVMQKATGSEDVAVIIEAKHSCVTARGIKNRASATFTTTYRGVFNDDKMQEKLLNMMR